MAEREKKIKRIEFEQNNALVFCEKCDEEYSYSLSRVRVNTNGTRKVLDGLVCPICQNPVEEI